MNRRAGRFTPPAHEPELPRAVRRARGVYYTPPEIVRSVVELALLPLLGESGQKRSPLRVLDPACGAGEFLVEVQRQLREAGPLKSHAEICGIDIDAAAVATARRRLRRPGARVRLLVGDALAPNRLGPESFDCIVGNPPYVNIRQLAKALSAKRRQALRERFQVARGNFDLYVLFIEQALSWLKPGGRCGLVLPNKWLALDYARGCRELLLAHTTIEHVIDLAGSGPFASAAVYPQILVFRKQPPPSGHLVQFRPPAARVAQASLAPEAFSFCPSLEIESRVKTAPLSAVATLWCGTAGYMAQRVARRLVDCGENEPPAGPLADFITSGNIDRYAIRLGNVRYLKRTYARPRLPLDAPELTPAKRRLLAGPKIVIAGLSRRLEAAFDAGGLALGVQVFAASECRVDPYFLLALLNSKLLSYLFATRFSAKRLGGGYLAINKGQLARLPIRMIEAADRADRRRLKRLSEIARQWRSSADAEADALVYQLYELTGAEIARIEAHFTKPAARAA